jgi:acyl carrier protein
VTTTNEIFDRMVPVFRAVFDDDNLVPTAGMTAKDVPEWDSLNHVRLVVSIEQEFGVKFTLNEVTELKNVGELATLIQKKL